MLEMKLSDKFNGIYELDEVDNKDAIVREIKALKNFTENELSSIFGSSSILWIIENYSVRELKSLVKKVEDNIVISVGDIIKFKITDEDITGVILEVTGITKNRCTALCYYGHRKYFKILEGISSFDIEVVDKQRDESFSKVLDTLGCNSNKDTSNILKEGDL